MVSLYYCTKSAEIPSELSSEESQKKMPSNCLKSSCNSQKKKGSVMNTLNASQTLTNAPVKNKTKLNSEPFGPNLVSTKVPQEESVTFFKVYLADMQSAL